MANLPIDPQAVIDRLSRQIGAQAAELAMRDVALDAAHARIAELEAAASSDTPAQDPPEGQAPATRRKGAATA